MALPRLARKNGPAMLANGAQHPQQAVLITNNQNRFPRRRGGKTVARIGNLFHPAHAQPTTRKYGSPLKVKEIRVRVARGRQHYLARSLQPRQDFPHPPAISKRLHAPPHRALNCAATICSYGTSSVCTPISIQKRASEPMDSRDSAGS